MSKAHCNDLPQRKALGLVTHDNTGGPFVVECQGCGEVYPSFQCLGGGQIADTGDHEDASCPHCEQVDPEECDNAALAWNTQQLKINELQQRLTVQDQRVDEQNLELEGFKYRLEVMTADRDELLRKLEVLRVFAEQIARQEGDPYFASLAKAALNPTTEAASHDE